MKYILLYWLMPVIFAIGSIECVRLGHSYLSMVFLLIAFISIPNIKSK